MNITGRCLVSASQKFSKTSLYRCEKSCHNAGGLATHMKTHDKSFEVSSSMLRFIKRAPRKAAIELKPMKPKPVQRKLSAKRRSKAVAPTSLRMLRDPQLQVAPPRPRLPRTKTPDSDLLPVWILIKGHKNFASRICVISANSSGRNL